MSNVNFIVQTIALGASVGVASTYGQLSARVLIPPNNQGIVTAFGGVSPDGCWAVGVTGEISSGTQRATLWNLEDGTSTILASLPPPAPSTTEAYIVANGGGSILGQVSSTLFGNQLRWTASQTPELLMAPAGWNGNTIRVTGTHPSGSFTIGRSSTTGLRWNAGQVIGTPLPKPHPQSIDKPARVVDSGDIFGTSQIGGTHFLTRWSGESVVPLSQLSGSSSSVDIASSTTGMVAGTTFLSPFSQVGWRYFEEGTVEYLLPSSEFTEIKLMTGTAEQGAIVFALAKRAESSVIQGVLWDATGGFHTTWDYFGELPLTEPGWRLWSVKGTSDNGQRLVGVAMHTSGLVQTVILDIPSPPIFVVGALSLTAVVRRRRLC